MITTLFGFFATFMIIGLFVLCVIFILVPIVKGGFAFGNLIGSTILNRMIGTVSDRAARSGTHSNVVGVLE